MPWPEDRGGKRAIEIADADWEIANFDHLRICYGARRRSRLDPHTRSRRGIVRGFAWEFAG